MKRPTLSIVLAILILLLILPLMAYAYAGTFSRYMADDYCTAGTLQRLGFVESQIEAYQHWSGRYSFTFVVSAVELIGPGAAAVLPALGLLALALSTKAAVKSSLEFLRFRLPEAYNVSLAALITSLTLIAIPNRFQSLYWQTGLLTYLVPLVLTNLYAAAFFRMASRRPASQATDRRWTLVGPILVFIAGGFSEIQAALQVAGFGMLASVSMFNQWRNAGEGPSRQVVLGLLAAIAALLLVALAPGNVVRLGQYGAPPDLAYFATHTALDVGHFVKEAVTTYWISTAAAAVAGLFFGMVIGHRTMSEPPRTNTLLSGWQLLWITSITVVLITTAMALSEYAIAAYPPDRALLPLQFIFAATLVVVSSTGGLSLVVRFRNRLGRRWIAGVGFTAVVLWGSTAYQTVQQTIDYSSLAADFVATWEQRDDQLRAAAAAGESEVFARSLTSMGTLAEIHRDPAFWVNACVADYYGLEQVIAKE